MVLDGRGRAQIIDLGFAARLAHCTGCGCGSPGCVNEHGEPMEAAGSLLYSAPELVAFGRGGTHTDWWVCGH